MKRTPLIAANWKMNKLPGEGRAFVEALTNLLPGPEVDLMIAPQGPMIAEVGEALKNSTFSSNHSGTRCFLGAQNSHWLASGAHTGEISPELLSKLGVSMVILGHSERRALYKEPDQEVALRVKAVLERGMAAILCVGETREQFERKESVPVVLAQLEASLKEAPRSATAELVVAYEPVWAIGTGLAASPDVAHQMHREIRNKLESLGFNPNTRILYGGSTTPENIGAFMATGEVDGALVGGASLDPQKFASLAIASRA